MNVRGADGPLTVSRQTAACRRPALRLGAATVEFACVAAVFFLLVLGIIEIGRGIMVKHLMLAAARQGCRVGILPGNGNAEIASAVQGALTPLGITAESITVQVNDGSGDAQNANSGDEVTVLVSVPVSAITWVPGMRYLGGNIASQYSLRKQ